jgi:hypothetical protein
MNENVLTRLEAQAEKKTLDLPCSLDADEYTQIFNEQLVKLAVQECIAVHIDDYGVDIIGDVLKKHFGIEESSGE